MDPTPVPWYKAPMDDGAVQVGHTTFGRGRREPGFATPWRVLPWLIVQGVEAGCYRIDHPSGSDLLPAGTAWCVPADCRHRHAVDGRQAVLTSHIHLTIRLPGGVDPLAGLAAPRILPRAMEGGLGSALRAVVTTPRRTGLAGTLAHQARLAQLASAVIEALGDALPPLRSAGVLDPVFAWIDANLHLPFERGELAARAGLAPSRFHERFLAATGEPPMAWVRRRRLARAAELLGGTDLGMAAIAGRTGFCDAFHLNKRFREAYGMPPTAFRRQARE